MLSLLLGHASTWLCAYSDLALMKVPWPRPLPEGCWKFGRPRGLPWWLGNKEAACQCRRGGFDPWVEKIPRVGKKGMATYTSSLAWEIPWTEEPGGLQSMGSQKSQT